jgi:5-methylcytosine-specific restriction protein A
VPRAACVGSWGSGSDRPFFHPTTIRPRSLRPHRQWPRALTANPGSWCRGRVLLDLLDGLLWSSRKTRSSIKPATRDSRGVRPALAPAVALDSEPDRESGLDHPRLAGAGERGGHRGLAEEQGMALVRFCLHCNTHHPGRCPRLEQRRGSSTQRGYDSRWRRLAADAIHRHPYCTICDSTVDLTADHIVPLSQGGTNTMSNIRVLCRSCNSRKGGRGWCSIEGRRLKDPAPGFRERNSKKRCPDLKMELKSGSDDG